MRVLVVEDESRMADVIRRSLAKEGLAADVAGRGEDALGMAAARDMMGGDEHVVCIAGDAAFTCGVSFEALNNVSSTTKRLIVVLNDNEWSIAKNVGAIASYLNNIVANPTYAGLHDKARRFIEAIAGKSAVGGRSIGEIADRFVEQAELGASSALPAETCALIGRFLAVAGTPSKAAAALRALAAEARVALGPALERFESRIAALAGRGVDVDRIEFATAFGRGVDYYTGFVFELHDPAARVDGQLVAGGRYDGLLSRLGSPQPVAAVGFAVWIERLAALAANIEREQ